MKQGRSVIKRLLACCTVTTLTACTLAGAPVPENHYYRLPAPHPAAVLDRRLIHGTLGVSPLRAVGLYQDRAILYVDSRSPLELHRYYYRFWMAPPGELIQMNLIDYLRTAGVARKVTRHEPGTPVNGLISGTIERFERRTGNRHDQVAVTLELKYGGADQQQPPVLLKTYAVTVPARSGAMEDIVAAFGAALNRIYDRFLHDLSAATGRIAS